MIQWETPKQAATRTQQSPDLIRAAVKCGDLPANPIGTGRDYRLDPDEVDLWMKSRSYEPKSA